MSKTTPPAVRAFLSGARRIGGEVAKYPSMLQAHLGYRTDTFIFAALAGESLSLLCASLLVGCTTPSHLIFHQSTSLGVDASANADTGQVHVAFGYDRPTNTLIPKTKTTNPQDEPEQEARSVVSASEVKIKRLGLPEVTEQFATGKAARHLAQDPRALGQVLALTVPTERP